VTERVGVIGRVRKLALGAAEAWMAEIGQKSEAVA
jgi:glycyl-tRNA synthetase alpha subunit